MVTDLTDSLRFWLIAVATIFILLAVFGCQAEAATPTPVPTPILRVSFRRAGGVVLSTTPTPIGENSERVEILLHNDVNSTGPMICGYDLPSLSQTPGPNSGDRLAPGEGKTICRFADKVLYCFSPLGSTVYFDEARIVTPTPTP